MKRLIFLTLAAALSASFAWGALGDIIACFPAPDDYPVALAVPGNYHYYLWVYCNTSPYRIYRVSGNTGSVYSYFDSPLGYNTRGLTYSWNGGGGLPAGSYLWIGNYTRPNYVYRCNYSTGSIYASFPARTKSIHGLAAKAIGDGGTSPTSMLVNNISTQYVYEKDLLTGSNISVFTAPEWSYDVAWDWRNELVWSAYWTSPIVYGYTTNGSVVASFSMPPYTCPLGFAYTSNYLWVSTTTGNQAIWKIHCPEIADNINVVPASIGKIKATYR